jgi:hypothetical protein
MFNFLIGGNLMLGESLMLNKTEFEESLESVKFSCRSKTGTNILIITYRYRIPNHIFDVIMGLKGNINIDSEPIFVTSRISRDGKTGKVFPQLSLTFSKEFVKDDKIVKDMNLARRLLEEVDKQVLKYYEKKKEYIELNRIQMLRSNILKYINARQGELLNSDEKLNKLKNKYYEISNQMNDRRDEIRNNIINDVKTITPDHEIFKNSLFEVTNGMIEKVIEIGLH